MRTGRTNRMARCWVAAATLLAGGTVLGTCELRMREALITSTKSLVFGIFETAAGSLEDSFSTTDGTTE